jgi:hypothetical protein
VLRYVIGACDLCLALLKFESYFHQTAAARVIRTAQLAPRTGTLDTDLHFFQMQRLYSHKL